MWKMTTDELNVITNCCFAVQEQQSGDIGRPPFVKSQEEQSRMVCHDVSRKL